MDMSWWIAGVVLLFSLSRRADTTHKMGAELQGELTSITTNHNALPYCVIRQPLLYLDFHLALSLSLLPVCVHDGVVERTWRGGWKVLTNTRECYGDRLSFVWGRGRGRVLKRYEASHIDRRHTETHWQRKG